MTKPSVVTRMLKVSGLEAQGDRVGERLRSLDGVAEATVDAGRGMVIVSYDLRRVALPQIVRHLETMGMKPSGGVLNSFRRAWAAFRDENIRASLAHQGHCCSQPPARR